ncbi:MAG: TIGR03668 family PPOX class F420-dependent oxidoreductase [Candidatus Rokubacteria bacterium]|nr:TIGR03668 family PPOX class F420-dependent oxidoreductase [Candidatus Rokubacteria bacterium]
MTAAPAWALDRLRAARVGRLATADAAGRPLVVPVCFALDAEGQRLYSAVDPKPKRTRDLQRVRNVRENPRVSLVVDEYDEDWTRLWWVMVRGPAAVLEEGPEFIAGVDLLIAKYPQYQALGLERERGVLVRVTIERVLAWRWSETGP